MPVWPQPRVYDAPSRPVAGSCSGACPTSVMAMLRKSAGCLRSTRQRWDRTTRTNPAQGKSVKTVQSRRFSQDYPNLKFIHGEN